MSIENEYNLGKVSRQNIFEYFKNLVEKGLDKQNINVSKTTEFYIVNLLSEYFRVEKLFIQGETGLEDVTLAVLFSKALSSNIRDRITLFKKIGDQSLYISGFFSDSFSRKTIDIDYYISMGKNAYNQLHYISIYSQKEKILKDTYMELASYFINFVDLITELSEEDKKKTNIDLLRTYEKWLITKSERLAKMLKEHGIMPNDNIAIKEIH